MSRGFRIGDFEYFVSPSQISASPDGSKALATFTRPLLRENSYRSWVEVYDVSSGEKLYSSSGPRDVLGRWSPDGKKVYYLKIRDDGIHQLVEVDGGYDAILMSFDRPVLDYRVCDHGVGYFLVRDSVVPQDEDFIYTEDIRLWFDAVGFVCGTIRKLYRVFLKSGYVESIEGVEGDVIAFDIDRECSQAVLAVSDDSRRPIFSKLYLLNLKSHSVSQLLDGEEYVVEGISVRGSLAALSAHRMEKGFASHLKLLLVDLANDSKLVYEAPMGFGLGRRLYSDVRGPNSVTPKPKIADNAVYLPLSLGGSYCVYSRNWSDGYREVLCGDFSVDEFDIAGSKLIFVMSDSVTPPELYVLDFESGFKKKLSDYNSWAIERGLARPRRIAFRASDGVEVEGWILPPITNALEVAGKSPVILEIHGGPKSKFGYAFMFEHHLLSSRGFYIVYMNPRGSDGYTEDFADIRLRYGERDLEDILEGLNHTLSLEPGMDPERIGVTGLSYGGFMTNWIVTKTDRFKTAVSQNGISMWLTEYGITDIGFYFVPDQIGATPFRNPELLQEKSPIYFVEKVRTPMLFIHSASDYRCYIDQSIAMHTALKHLNKESALALFKEGGHTFAWSGKPRARYKRYKLLLEWFEKHLRK
ncbi:MAG: S9 family peptidase [Sulfolobales archaeon]|nr:S9 family peptidase [Sulfolobales archaeon]MDW8082773.1 S9 family peptidase [Sulfolobales archaeon]